MKTTARSALAFAATLSLACGCALAQSDASARQATGNTTSTDQRSTRSDGMRSDDNQSDSNDWQQAGQVGASTGNQARTGNATSADDFGRLDSDHDGRISGAEAAVDNGLSARFKTLDANGDGYVSSAEFRAGMRADTPTAPP